MKSLKKLLGRLSLSMSSLGAFSVDHIVGECVKYTDTFGCGSRLLQIRCSWLEVSILLRQKSLYLRWLDRNSGASEDMGERALIKPVFGIV